MRQCTRLYLPVYKRWVVSFHEWQFRSCLYASKQIPRSSLPWYLVTIILEERRLQCVIGSMKEEGGREGRGEADQDMHDDSCGCVGLLYTGRNITMQMSSLPSITQDSIVCYTDKSTHIFSYLI